MAAPTTTTVALDDLVEARALDFSACGLTRCHGHGSCVTAGDDLPACECLLGYQAPFCVDSVNEAVSVPLTLGVLFTILGVVVLAFIVAFARQRRKVQRRKAYAAMRDGNSVEGGYP